MEFQHLDNIVVDNNYIKNIVKNIGYNSLIANYYRRLMEEYPEMKHTFKNKLDRLTECNKFWLLDVYERQKVKDYKKTNLCKDKFCNNCKKVKQAARMTRFMPYIEQYSNFGLYQMVLTVPNVAGVELRNTIKKMFKAFKTIIRYLSGNLKVKGISFNDWGYKGAIRALEVTYRLDDYHPHLHVLLCMEGDVGEKNIENVYSIDFRGNKARRLFSDKEILIQKIWYLLLNDIKVTKKNIENIRDIRKELGECVIDDIGYSCMIDEVKEGDYLELFKYLVKGDGKEDLENDKSIMTYENFKTLYFALDRVRQIQGYGCFYNIKDDDSIIDEVDKYYDLLVKWLQKEESPVEKLETPQDLLNSNYTIISRKRIFRYLCDLKDV